jgi:hypothetical protein
MIENAYWLVIDRVWAPSAVDRHWMESRFHTLAGCRRGKDWVSLRSGAERLQMTFAALNGGVLQEARGLPSQPVAQTRIYRWLSAAASHDNLHVTALNPGGRKLSVTVGRTAGGIYRIDVAGGGRRKRRIRLNGRLELG